MKKKQIEKIEFPQMVVRASRKTKEPVGTAQLIEIDGVEHLIVDIATNGEKALRLAYTKNDYAAFMYKKLWLDGRCGVADGWTCAGSDTISEKSGGRYNYLTDRMNMSKTEKDLVYKFYGEELYGNVRWVLKKLEENVKQLRNRRRESIRIKNFREMLDSIPDIPERFLEWAEKQLDGHYIFYEPYRRQKTTDGFCTACGRSAEYKRGELKLKQIVVCKNCKTAAIAHREHDDMSSVIENSKLVGMLQMSEQGLVQRSFWVKRVYERFRRERTEIEEVARVYICQNRKGKLKLTKHYKDVRWCGCEGYKNTWVDGNVNGSQDGNLKCSDIWPGNVTKELFAETPYRYSAVEILVRNRCKIGVIDYILDYAENPALEVFVKMGLTKIIDGRYNIRGAYERMKDGAKPWEVLGLNKEQLNRLIEINGGWSAVEALRTENKTKMDCITLEWFDRYRLDKKTLGSLTRRASHERIKDYIEKQRVNYPGMSIGGIAEQWMDYIGMAQLIGSDLESTLMLMPKNLKKRHDELVKLTGDQKAVIRRTNEVYYRFPKIAEQFERLQRYRYENPEEEYCIVPPMDIHDIVVEGTALGHCLANTDRYFERIAQGESFIVFMRKKEDKKTPYCTLEIQPGGTIRQKQILGGNPLKDEAGIEFLRRWQKVLKKQLTEEEKEAEKKSTEIRLADYKKLRDDGEKVRNGRFKGQLLADILEDDLLIAE